ncbi:hypothetical protein N7509_005178 [Penicillium cosmopolitanum]|uniref:Uncharacterized protein n=1 Tax=Penicillium cosmopolitanum TaxID=1131564 RepID=A0A9X0B9U4_9EURO|nr:uncharacterized protein N7509_005178 [Penicillium cosmopolitanum]KAJ5397065.1 hypothetical protein N7509_005178 [Penicillium cosmopolitanum]
MRFPHTLLLLAVAQLSTAWLVKYYATEEIKHGWGTTVQTTVSPVVTTAPLTVEPTSTSTTYSTDYITRTDGGNYRINVTIEYLILPNVTNLPISAFYVWDPPVPTQNPSVTTNYYLPVTLSNPASCTKTEFTYTDSARILLPKFLKAQATESTIATFVSNYVSTISTNLGGQEVTTSRCDVYMNDKIVPMASIDLFDYERYLTECIDPRRSMCSSGENTEATGTGGCLGVYPPTGTADSASTTTTSNGVADPTQTGAATTLRSSIRPLSILACIWATLTCW